MQNFLLGLDEACIMVDAGVNSRMVGAADMEKYEKIILDR